MDLKTPRKVTVKSRVSERLKCTFLSPKLRAKKLSKSDRNLSEISGAKKWSKSAPTQKWSSSRNLAGQMAFSVKKIKSAKT